MVKANKIKAISQASKIPCVIAFVCVVLFVFNFWLFFPGHISTDWVVMMDYLGLDGHYPVMYPFIFSLLSNVFEKHLFFPLFFNLIPFYLAIYVLCLGLWYRFSSKWCFAALLPIFVGNILFNNIILHSCFSSAMFIFLLWSMVLYQILVGITRKNTIALVIAFLFAVLSRHNALIQVYPIFFVYSYFIVQYFGKRMIFVKCVGLLLLFAFFTIIVAFGLPLLMQSKNAHPSTLIFLHQIAGACVPNHDKACFEQKWYEYGKNYEDVERLYWAEPLNADYMAAAWQNERPFKSGALEELQMMWLKSIIKYPADYWAHISRYIQSMWLSSTVTDLSPSDQHYSIYITDVEWVRRVFPDGEIFYQPSVAKIKIYNFLRLILPVFKTLHWIVLNFIIFIVVGILFIRRRNVLLLYVMSSSIAGSAASLIFCIFSPVPAWNYVYPAFISTIVSVIGIAVYIYDTMQNKQDLDDKIRKF